MSAAGNPRFEGGDEAMHAGRAVRRREFLAAACDLGRIAVVGLVAGRWSVSGAEGAGFYNRPLVQTRGRKIMLDEVTVSEFAACLGSAFRVYSETGRGMELELIEATPLGPQSRGGGSAKREGFSLVFRGPAEPVLPQRIHAIEHATLGRMELFLVPIGPDARGMRYEAVFN